MSEHRYSIGQTVRMKYQPGTPRPQGDLYKITGTLPERGNSPQYRIRSDTEIHDRVVTEDILEDMETPPGEFRSS